MTFVGFLGEVVGALNQLSISRSEIPNLPNNFVAPNNHLVIVGTYVSCDKLIVTVAIFPKVSYNVSAHVSMYKETTMSADHTIDSARFPHVDLGEPSARPGFNGPRYVPIADNRLGDTNEGRVVYPQDHQEMQGSFHEDASQHQDALCITDGGDGIR